MKLAWVSGISALALLMCAGPASAASMDKLVADAKAEGQLTVIAVAYLLVGRWFGKEPWYRRWITLPASAMIGVVGLYWTVQRLLF